MAKQAVKKAKPKTKAKEAPKRGRGRPRKVISAAEVQKMAAIGCTQEEIAKVKGVSATTIMRNYGDAYEKGFATMQMSLRRRQMRAALAGSNTMMIWLGKQYLGQRDKAEMTGKDGASLVPGTIVFTMPRNGRDTAVPAAKAPPAETLSKPMVPPPIPPPPPTVEPTSLISPAPKPMPVPVGVIENVTALGPGTHGPGGTKEGTEPTSSPVPRYRGGGRDSRVVENVRTLKPISDGGPAASTGKR